MRRITRFRPTPSMVVASIALLVALGGTSVAAVNALAPANSVGTAAVIDNSLLKQDFKAGQLPAGKPGKAGKPGPAGAPGSALAYAHVNKDGSLDEANSKNVVMVPAKNAVTSSFAQYCLKVTGDQRPHNAVATLDISASADKQIAVVIGRDISSSCNGDADAVVNTAIDQTGASQTNAFYIVFN